MSTPAPEAEPQHHGVSGALTAISVGLIRVLPPAFLLLLIFNVVFLAGIAWVFDRNAEQRNVLLTRIVEKCLLEPRQRP